MRPLANFHFSTVHLNLTANSGKIIWLLNLILLSCIHAFSLCIGAILDLPVSLIGLFSHHWFQDHMLSFFLGLFLFSEIYPRVISPTRKYLKSFLCPHISKMLWVLPLNFKVSLIVYDSRFKLFSLHIFKTSCICGVWSHQSGPWCIKNNPFVSFLLEAARIPLSFLGDWKFTSLWLSRHYGKLISLFT